jgi:hypothetical protein
MMPEYDQVLKVKEDAEARLRTIPGVHAVGIGRKVLGGEPTGELSIVVFLVNKKPLDRLAPEEVVPPEIDGVLTDVVEMAIPRLVADDPGNLIPTVNPGGRTVTFRGHAKPGNGLGVVLTYTVGTPPGLPGNVFLDTHGDMTKGNIAATLADELTAVGFPCKADPLNHADDDATLRLEPGVTCTLTDCYVIAVDDKKYSKDYLRGGVQIQLKGTEGGMPQLGTLGCLAGANGKIVAITCHHVVAGPEREARKKLGADWQQQGDQIKLGGADHTPPGTVVFVQLYNSKQVVVYSTLDGDTPTTIAGRVSAAIMDLGISGVNATNGTPPTAVITLTGETVFFTKVYGSVKTDDKADLHAKVTGLVIDLSGEVSDDNYGIFININLGGLRHPTFGAFFHPPKRMALSTIADKLATAINALPIGLRTSGTVDAPILSTATANNKRITIDHAQEVECIIKRDCRVGQPTDDFCSSCSHCCNDLIGHVIDSRVDVDAAIVQVDGGFDYKPVIQGVAGSVTGTYDVKPEDMHTLTVSKRGFATGLTFGTVETVHLSGEAEGRLFVDAVSIRTQPDPDPKKQFFCLPRVSGAAVLNGNQVAGIVFGQSGQIGLMTPISQIIAAFPALSLNLAPPGGKVPKNVAAPAPAAAAVAQPEPALFSPTSFLGQRLAQMEKEIEATPVGSEVADAVRRHFTETHKLVTTNRRVAAVWRRSGGPQIVQAVLDLVHRSDNRLPEEIDGRPFAECLERIKNVLARYASPALADDLARFSPRLEGFSGFTYAEVLSALQAGGTE